MSRQCSFCSGRFGLIRHHHWDAQFCRKSCKEAYLKKIAEDREKARRFLDYLNYRPP